MASPQKEKGYTPVANEILDQICQFKFNGAQLRIIVKLWRMTYGYHTKDADFALDYIEQSTKLAESTIKKEVSLLIRAKVLLVTKRQTKETARKIKFNKNYEQWKIPRSGDNLDEKEDGKTLHQVHDTVLQNSEVEVYDTVPVKVYDSVLDSDHSDHFEVYDTDPIKDIKDLKIKIFKDKVILFDKFYSFYPRKVSKAAGKKAWIKLAKEDDFDPACVIQNTLNFAETCKLIKTEVRYIPHPSTYLNQRRFEDYPVIDPEGLAKEKETKFDSNMDFFRNQLGGAKNGSGSSINVLSESNIVLPEQST